MLTYSSLEVHQPQKDDHNSVAMAGGIWENSTPTPAGVENALLQCKAEIV
jgi:hypothetical protein